jgi:phage tail sheath protein FI
MPVTPTYPGVYIEELPSAVRTITAVSTSVTAFVGSIRRGPNFLGSADRKTGLRYLLTPRGGSQINPAGCR